MYIYYNYAPDGSKIVVLYYVDDCVYCFTNENLGKWFVDTLGKRFHVNFLGYAHWFMSIRISQLKDHSISVDKARYATSIVAKYLDTATVKLGNFFHKTTLPADMIFSKEDVSTSDEQVDKLTREYNIHYRACIGSLIYLLSTRVDLSFSVHKLAKFSANPGKVHFEGLIHLLGYIRDNKTLGLKYYADLNDAPVTDLLRKANIKTKNHLMPFSDSSWQDCPDTGRSTGVYITFYQGRPIEHETHVPGPFAQSIAESEYNAACTAVMALANFRMLIHEFLRRDPDIAPEEAPLIVLASKSAMCMAKNLKATRHTRHIASRMHFISNGEKCKMQKID